MDFDAVFQLILKDFQGSKIDFALIGGFALASFGHPRATVDIDFLVDKKDFAKVKKFMSSYGYKLDYESEDVANFKGGIDKLGGVDFLLAHRKYSKAMLGRAITKNILDDKFKVKVIIPEDLIGLKVQSSTNDPERYHQDMADIEVLFKENFRNLNMELIKEYFSIFNRTEELNKILEKVKHVK